MTSFEGMKRELADLIKAREIARLVYFHTDHFEPWKKVAGRRQLSRENVDDLVTFTDALKPIDYARRLTLFYRNYFKVILGERAGGLKAHPDDRITFMPRSEAERALCTEGMGYLAAHSGHDLQVHIHHESFTYNLSHKHPKFIEYFADPAARRLDDDRLALALTLHKQYFREETGIDLQRWFFVHGHWALNASDPDTCFITREIEILMRHGCAGDFTFPAGRKHVNPQLRFPYFCKPVDAARGYDTPECEPEFAYGNAAAASKFFIWASEIDHRGSSIDYYVPWIRQKLEDPLAFAVEILTKSFVVDGTLYFKTHAHSLYPDYFEGARKPIFPHEHPAIQRLLCLIFDAAAAAGCEVQFLGASDVYESFRAAEHVRPDGFEVAISTPVFAMPEGDDFDTEQAFDDEVEAAPGGPAAPASSADPLAKLKFAVASTLANRGGAPAPMPAEAAKVLADSASSTTAGDEKMPLSAGAVSPNHMGTSLLRQGRQLPHFNRFNAAAAAAVAARIDALGEQESGAYAHYARRLAKGDVIGELERTIADYVRLYLDYEGYTEIGCCFGLLPMLLGSLGLDADGLENDKRRFETALALRDTLSVEFPEIATHSRTEFLTFPEGLADRDVSGRLAIVTDLMSRTLETRFDDFVGGLARFGGVLLEVDRFGQRRASIDEQNQLIGRLHGFGLGRPREAYVARQRMVMFEKMIRAKSRDRSAA